MMNKTTPCFQTSATGSGMRRAIGPWIFAVMAGAHAAEPFAAHPLSGTWRWSQFAGKCAESYQYRPDGVMLGSSGESATEWTYTVSPQASTTGFYQVIASLVRQNGKKDCSGDTAPENGTTATAFVQFSPAKDRYISCREESLAACFGPLVRVKQAPIP